MGPRRRSARLRFRLPREEDAAAGAHPKPIGSDAELGGAHHGAMLTEGQQRLPPGIVSQPAFPNVSAADAALGRDLPDNGALDALGAAINAVANPNAAAAGLQQRRPIAAGE